MPKYIITHLLIFQVRGVLKNLFSQHDGLPLLSPLKAIIYQVKELHLKMMPHDYKLSLNLTSIIFGMEPIF